MTDRATGRRVLRLVVAPYSCCAWPPAPTLAAAWRVASRGRLRAAARRAGAIAAPTAFASSVRARAPPCCAARPRRRPPIWGYRRRRARAHAAREARRGAQGPARQRTCRSRPLCIGMALRMPNAMDGVPHLTQEPVAPGKSFDYRFKVAGRRHVLVPLALSARRSRSGARALRRADRRRAGRRSMSIATWCSCSTTGGCDPTARSTMRASARLHDAAHHGRVGEHLTVNGRPSSTSPCAPTSGYGLRLINAANARLIAAADRAASRDRDGDRRPAGGAVRGARQPRRRSGPATGSTCSWMRRWRRAPTRAIFC